MEELYSLLQAQKNMQPTMFFTQQGTSWNTYRTHQESPLVPYSLMNQQSGSSSQRLLNNLASFATNKPNISSLLEGILDEKYIQDCLIPPKFFPHRNGPFSMNENDPRHHGLYRSLTEIIHGKSVYRGVVKCNFQRFEAYVWDNSEPGVKGRPVYVGAYTSEFEAAKAHDMVSLKIGGIKAFTNFPVKRYAQDMEEMTRMNTREYIFIVRWMVKDLSEGCSPYRGVYRIATVGRKWEARLGREGSSTMRLGTYYTAEDAARAFDIISIKLKGRDAITNFDLNSYEVNDIMKRGITIQRDGTLSLKKKVSDNEAEAQHHPPLSQCIVQHNHQQHTNPYDIRVLTGGAGSSSGSSSGNDNGGYSIVNHAPQTAQFSNQNVIQNHLSHVNGFNNQNLLFRNNNQNLLFHNNQNLLFKNNNNNHNLLFNENSNQNLLFNNNQNLLFKENSNQNLLFSENSNQNLLFNDNNNNNNNHFLPQSSNFHVLAHGTQNLNLDKCVSFPDYLSPSNFGKKLLGGDMVLKSSRNANALNVQPLAEVMVNESTGASSDVSSFETQFQPVETSTQLQLPEVNQSSEPCNFQANTLVQHESLTSTLSDSFQNPSSDQSNNDSDDYLSPSNFGKKLLGGDMVLKSSRNANALNVQPLAEVMVNESTEALSDVSSFETQFLPVETSTQLQLPEVNQSSEPCNFQANTLVQHESLNSTLSDSFQNPSSDQSNNDSSQGQTSGCEIDMDMRDYLNRSYIEDNDFSCEFDMLGEILNEGRQDL